MNSSALLLFPVVSNETAHTGLCTIHGHGINLLSDIEIPLWCHPHTCPMVTTPCHIAVPLWQRLYRDLLGYNNHVIFSLLPSLAITNVALASHIYLNLSQPIFLATCNCGSIRICKQQPSLWCCLTRFPVCLQAVGTVHACHTYKHARYQV